MENETKVKAVYKDNELKKIFIRYKKETPSGYVWAEEELPPVPGVFEIKKAEDHNGKPAFNLKAYGKLEEIFQQ